MSKVESFINEYSSKKELYKSFSETINQILRNVLSASGIKYFVSSFREKEIDKLKEKIVRKESKPEPYTVLTDIEDLAGCRVVTYLDSDRYNVVRFCHEEFEILDSFEKNTDDGYRGSHLIIKLNSKRNTLLEYKRYSDLKCEIQVSSVLFHAWSEIEHDIVYKPALPRMSEIGLDEIKDIFQKLMAQHIESASIKLDEIVKLNAKLVAAGQIIFSDFELELRNASSIEEVISKLDIIQILVSKKQGDILQFVEISLQLPLDSKVIDNYNGKDIYGQSREDLIIKCFEIINQYPIKYSSTRRVISILLKFIDYPVKSVVKKAQSHLIDLASYDHIFIKANKSLSPQVEIYHTISDSSFDRTKHLSLVLDLSKEILSFRSSGSELRSDDSLVLHNAKLTPTEPLIDLRRKIITLLLDLLQSNDLLSSKIQITECLLTGLFPSIPEGESRDYAAIINVEADQIVNDLEPIIFKNDYTSINLPLSRTIVSFFTQQNKPGLIQSSRVVELIESIKSNTKYRLFNSLVGDLMEYNIDNFDFRNIREIRLNDVSGMLDKLNPDTFNYWYDNLNELAGLYSDGYYEEYKFEYFKKYLYLLTQNKKELANQIFHKALAEKDSIIDNPFLIPYLSSLRENACFDDLDFFIDSLLHQNLTELYPAILISLILDDKYSPKDIIRSRDLLIIKSMIDLSKQLGNETESGIILSNSIIRALAKIFNYSPVEIEALLIEHLENHPQEISKNIGTIEFLFDAKWIDQTKLSENAVHYFINVFSKIDRISYHLQEELMQFGSNPSETILKIISNRINIEDNHHGSIEAFPYQLNEKFRSYLISLPEFYEVMLKWVNSITIHWSPRNHTISHILEEVGSPVYENIIRHLTEIADRDSLIRATRLLETFDGSSIELTMLVVEKTDDKDILDHLSANISSTGVVGGEYGLAVAWERKSETMKTYIPSENQRVSTYAKYMAKYFEDRAREERKRVADNIKRRKALGDL